jgi:hypothetical protein
VYRREHQMPGLCGGERDLDGFAITHLANLEYRSKEKDLEREILRPHLP